MVRRTERMLYCAILMTLFLGVTMCHSTANSKKTDRKLTLLEIKLYRSGLGTRRTEVDLADRRIRSLGRFQKEGRQWWATFESPMPQKTVDTLCKLASDCDLSSFEPQAGWFDKWDIKRHGLREGSADIVFVWREKEKVFRLPPDEVGSRMNRQARQTYRTIRQIARLVADLETEHSKTSNLCIVGGPEAREVEQLQSELTVIWSKTLPRLRDGW